MRRADRLLQIIQVLRRRRKPTTAALLAEELEVSIRTIYRDMAALLSSNVPIEGEAGVGYVLRAGYDLPPLMFTVEEIEALVLGVRMVAQAGDAALARAAKNAVAKVEHVLPSHLREMVARTTLFAAPHRDRPASAVDLGLVRAAIRQELKLEIAYRDEQHNRTRRRIWPIALAFFTNSTLICAWCELRNDFRHFRADRVEGLIPLADRYEARRGALVRDYLARMAGTGPAMEL